jgi:hypothetical protein
MAAMKETIVIAGSMAQKPGHGGHTWVFLQYLLGFKRLGWNVIFLDRLEPEMCVDHAGRPCPLAESFNLQYFLDVMHGYGLEDSFALLYETDTAIGLSRQSVLEHVRNSTFLLNVMGYLDDPEILEQAGHRVFLDIDPGFGQIWCDLGLADPFQGHDDFVTIGLNLGRPECPIPTCGLNWIKTPQPVVLDLWRPAPNGADGPITSIVSWRGPFAPLTYRDRTYGLRVHEFRKFVPLPTTSRHPLELALDIHPCEKKDLALLHDHGWRLTDPRDAAGDPIRYQAYIQASRAELMVAKNIYVESAGGWFSDRSICYLASGKPVLAQDTGLRDHFPTNQGLLSFRTLDECRNGLEELDRNYPDHASAARRIAEEYFDSDLVLTRLCRQLGAA